MLAHNYYSSTFSNFSIHFVSHDQTINISVMYSYIIVINVNTMYAFQWTFLERLEGAGVLSPSVDFGRAGNFFLVYVILCI